MQRNTMRELDFDLKIKPITRSKAIKLKDLKKYRWNHGNE
jgi:hypothetical protein